MIDDPSEMWREGRLSNGVLAVSLILSQIESLKTTTTGLKGAYHASVVNDQYLILKR